MVKGGILSEKWWRGFLKRNPQISLRASHNFGQVRTLVQRPIIETFYQRLLDTMMKNQYGSLLEKPHLIFKADKSSFEFDAINKIGTAAKGMKHVPQISKGQHEKVTVLARAAAAGNSLPPLFIFKSSCERILNGVQEGAPPGTLFTVQKFGWIDTDLYLKWFDVLFLKSMQAERPVLLIVDGHKAHVTEDVIKLAAANRVLVFCLPAHASHLLQPLDLLLFGPLKKDWMRACAAFHHLTSAIVTQRNFAKNFSTAWNFSNTPDVIRGGFRKSGIYPFKPQAFDYSKLAPINPEATSTLSSSVTQPPLPSAHLKEWQGPSSISGSLVSLPQIPHHHQGNHHPRSCHNFLNQQGNHQYHSHSHLRIPTEHHCIIHQQLTHSCP